LQEPSRRRARTSRKNDAPLSSRACRFRRRKGVFMDSAASRRAFLLSAAALPAAAQQKPGKPAPAPVRHRILGKTGLKVTELGFGSEAVSDISVFERALDAGINFFDTARGYQGGNAEQALGAALRGKRDRAILSTRSYAGNARQIALDLDASLKALGTDHV